jgi:hypothetical protein
MKRYLVLAGIFAMACSSVSNSAVPSGVSPIVFVTQVPIATDFTTIGSTFGNHLSSMEAVARGGDLYIRYGDGKLKNLTGTAGFGVASGMQGANAIAVRDPSVHWDGKKVVFSMVVGAPTKQYELATFLWQIYEITGLGESETPVIKKLANQPQYNNVSPIYGTDDRIIFTSDRPRDNSSHLYPQRDEYESAFTNTGLWSLEPVSGNLKLLNHAPSGNFTPTLDSFGRIIFTQWDHLKRDQQADADKYAGGSSGTFNYASEAANAAKLNSRAEIFPEPRVDQEIAGTNLNKHDFNQFFPWMILEDGTESETLNHAGRHELMSGDARGYIEPSLTDDTALQIFSPPNLSKNANYIDNMFQVKEDPSQLGTYIGINAPEFNTHASGQLVSVNGAPSVSVNEMKISYITSRDTASPSPENQAASPDHSGMYRDPLPMKNGDLIVAHTNETRADKTGNSMTASRYAYRLKTMKKLANGLYGADQALTNGISKTLEFWSPDNKVTYSGNLWELQPVELIARSRPAKRIEPLPSLEQQVFNQAGVSEAALKAYLTNNNLALAVVRNVTTRDAADKQQPFHLKVPNGVQSLGADYSAGQKIYEVAKLQFFQADLIRGYGGTADPREGRRVLAQVLHDTKAVSSNTAYTDFTPSSGSVTVSSDGSVAAFVPAKRALSWQLTDAAGTGVVRERYWVTFQPGEVRVCGSCHGLNDKDQAGQGVPNNAPKALLELLKKWKIANP